MRGSVIAPKSGFPAFSQFESGRDKFHLFLEYAWNLYLVAIAAPAKLVQEGGRIGLELTLSNGLGLRSSNLHIRADFYSSQISSTMSAKAFRWSRFQ
jgi:hypothetical protein